MDEFVEVVRVLVGDRPENLRLTRQLGCVYHFITPPPGTIKQVEGAEAVARMEGILDIELFVKPGDVIPRVRVGTERSGFLITGGASRDEAYKRAVMAEATINIEYECPGNVPAI